MERLSQLIHFDPITWGLLASIVTVVLGMFTIIGIIKRQSKESTDTVTASAKADVTNTNRNETHIHLPPPQIIQWPSQPPTVPPVSPPATQETITPSPTLTETSSASLEQTSPLLESPLEPVSSASLPEVIAPSESATLPETLSSPPETPSPTSALVVADEPASISPIPASDPGMTYFQNTGVRDQVESVHVQPAPTVEEKVVLESAPSSGKLAADHIARRASLRAMLRNASFLVQEIRSYADKYGRPSQSDQPYRNNVRLHRALLDYLRATRDPVFRLNAAMNKLTLAAWSEKDPRAIFFAAPDPLSAGTPSQARLEFMDTLEGMVKNVRDMGYTVNWREELSDPDFPNRKWTYHLTKARNLKVESFDVQDDEGEEEDDEVLEDEMSDDA